MAATDSNVSELIGARDEAELAKKASEQPDHFDDTHWKSQEIMILVK